MDWYFRERGRLHAQHNPVRHTVLVGLLAAAAGGVIGASFAMDGGGPWPSFDELVPSIVLGAVVFAAVLATVTVIATARRDPLPAGTDSRALRTAQRLIAGGAPGPDRAANALALHLAHETLAEPRTRFLALLGLILAVGWGVKVVVVLGDGETQDAVANGTLALAWLVIAVRFHRRNLRYRYAKKFHDAIERDAGVRDERNHRVKSSDRAVGERRRRTTMGL